MGLNRAKIISASRRTDIPAFYSEWFMNRIREGYCVYPNPMYPATVYRVSLLPEDVLGFVFWTRHASPLFKGLSELDTAGFVYYFQYTITGYPRSMEQSTPSMEVATDTFKSLSNQIGPERVIWRYDPIILNKELTADWHRDNFRRIADRICGFTKCLIVSIVDPYSKTQRRIGSSEDGVQYGKEAYADVLQMIVGEAAQRSLVVQACAETSMGIDGINMGGCVDGRLIYAMRNQQEPAKFKLQKQRQGCLCHESVDIGVNESCGFGCLYCYAIKSHEQAQNTLRRHSPKWTCINRDLKVANVKNNVKQQTLF